MSNPQIVIRTIASHCFLPIACSILVGLLFAGANIFDRSFNGFQFVLTPIVASIYYYLLVFLKPRNAHAGLLVLFFLTLLSTKSMEAVFIIRDLFYVAAIGTTVFVYLRYFRERTVRLIYYPAVVFAGLYGVSNIIASIIQLSFNRIFNFGDIVSTYGNAAMIAAFFGVTIGFPVGLGIGISGQLFKKD